MPRSLDQGARTGRCSVLGRARTTVGRVLLTLLVLAGSVLLAPTMVGNAQGLDVVGVLTQPSAPLPALRDAPTIADQTVALHAANGGATVSLYFGDLIGQPLYVVNIYPEAGVIVPGATIRPALIQQFIADNMA